MTENYGASRDPPEKSAPMCTVHSFPHNIDHCLTWARSEFEGMLEKAPSEANTFLQNPEKYKDSSRSSGDAQSRDQMEKVVASLKLRPPSFDACLEIARKKFQEYFYDKVAQLTYTFPEDAVTSTGAPFWSAPKRFPTVVDWSASDPAHVSFVQSLAILLAEIYRVEIPDYARDPAKVAEMAAKFAVPSFVAQTGVKIETDPKATGTAVRSDGINDMEVIESLCLELDKLQADLPSGFKMSPVAFEKDDDTNYHMDLITALANMRARNYRLQEVDKLKAKLIAGRIIPAIATATAMATGLVCLEVYKVAAGTVTAFVLSAAVAPPPVTPLLSATDLWCELTSLQVIQAKKVDDYRNTFANLALPLFAQSEPIAPKQFKFMDMQWSMWDRWTLKGDLTVQEVLDWFLQRKLTAYSISCGQALLYNNIFPKHKVHALLGARAWLVAGLPSCHRTLCLIDCACCRIAWARR